MNAQTATTGGAEPRRKQSVWMRLLWFAAGGVVNYLLISTPLKYLKLHHPSWPDMVNTGLSASVGTAFFFFWNYFVNFRTGSRKRDALTRYIIAVSALGALQWLSLWAFTHIDTHPYIHLDLLHFIGVPLLNINRDVVAMQFCLGGFKFLIYHFWAFPAHKEK